MFIFVGFFKIISILHNVDAVLKNPKYPIVLKPIYDEKSKQEFSPYA